MTNPRPQAMTTDEVVRQLYADANPDHTRHVVTVAELRARLAAFPDDTIVVLAKDSEGNECSPLCTEPVEAVLYYPDSPWSGDVESADNEPVRGALFAVLLEPTN
jgi:hypothetical protein